ncbi:MAG: TIGR01212 family radical SAM protein [Clostridia bacterium]|nr:TIGR01212 family radical SAM protein [Clostridia bacterium]
MRYNNLSEYLRGRFGGRLGKICIDAGFTCPNRDGRCGEGGCIFCGERGAGEHIQPGAISEQVRAVVERDRKQDKFVAYFQNFTNTYAPVEVLRERYDEAVAEKKVKVLAVGTRPDCISEEVAALLAEYKERCEVWVELGLQTSNDEVARLIRRGYKSEVFLRATEILKKHGIPFIVHLMAGLPGESLEDFKKSLDFVNKTLPFGIKIHSLYVMRGTNMEKMYRENLYTPPTQEEYAEAVVYAIAHTPRSVIFHRLTGDCPRDLLVAPEWNADKNGTLDRINSILEERGLTQGCLE